MPLETVKLTAGFILQVNFSKDFFRFTTESLARHGGEEVRGGCIEIDL